MYLELLCENGHVIAGSSDGGLPVYLTCQECEDPDDPGCLYVTGNANDETYPLKQRIGALEKALDLTMSVVHGVVASRGEAVGDETLGRALRAQGVCLRLVLNRDEEDG